MCWTLGVSFPLHTTYENDNSEIFTAFTWKITAPKINFTTESISHWKSIPWNRCLGYLKVLKMWAQVSCRYPTIVFAENCSTCIPPPPPSPRWLNKAIASAEREEKLRKGKGRYIIPLILCWLGATSESVIAKTMLPCGLLWSYSFDARANWKALRASSALLQGGKSAYTNYEQRFLHPMNKFSKFKLSTQ